MSVHKKQKIKCPNCGHTQFDKEVYMSYTVTLVFDEDTNEFLGLYDSELSHVKDDEWQCAKCKQFLTNKKLIDYLDAYEKGIV